MEIIAFLNSNLSDLLGYINDANKRIFGLYLLSALLLAIPVFCAQSDSKNPLAFLRFVFPKRIYLAYSARQDFLLLPLNKLIKAALFAPVVATMVPIALGTTEVLESLFGQRPPLQLSSASVVFCFTLALFVMDDFTRFILHYALHRIPLLWAFHKVHHSAKVMTPFTIYRSHPVENVLYASRMAIAQGTVVGLGYYLFGPTLKMLDILGANAFVFAFNIMGSNLRHSHIWLSWGNRVEAWFISPAQHQIHHSIAPEHYDRNLGSALAIWDRLFGTLIKASAANKVEIGPSNSNDAHDSILQIYYKPFVDAGRVLLSPFKALKAVPLGDSASTTKAAPKNQEAGNNTK